MATGKSRASLEGVPPGGARRVAYLVAGLIALAFSYDLMRVPIQVSDSLLEILEAQRSRSAWAAFIDQFGGAAYFRPLRIAQIKALFDLAHGHYWLVYRGFHALLLTAALLLFTRALRVRTWTDCAAAVFALTVLTGLHTFRGTVREAFPFNHFLEIVVFCLIALNLSRSRGGWWIDLAAVVTFVAASLTLETGLLVWVVVVTAWAGGMGGVSRRGVIAMSVFLGGYLVFRFWYLSTGTPGLDERSSGFLLRMLEPNELAQRFGANPTWFYTYNVATSVLSVLFSEPDGGVFEIARAWLQDGIPPRLYVAVISSVLTTGLIAWAVVGRWRRHAQGGLDDGDRLLIIALAVLIANSVLSYAYTKHEIISVAGVFYAFAAFVAARHALEYLGEPHRRAGGLVVVALLAILAVGWAFRSAGVHHLLRVQAFKVRNDWARLSPAMMLETGTAAERRSAVLVRQIRQDALEMRVTNTFLLPRWADRWWGE
jgi:hypothetical protein